MEFVREESAKKFKSPQDELVYLREQVRLREQELAEKNIRMEKPKIVAEKLSKYNDLQSLDVLHQNYALPEKKIGQLVLNLSPEKHDKKMSELLSLMQTKGVKNTLSVLKGLKDPHLEDDFHRMLVQYIQTGNKVINMPEQIEKTTRMVLYEVILPEEETGKQKSLSESVSAMEQFLSGMMSLHSKYDEGYFTIEIANANGSEQFVLYVSVPQSKKDLFEKQITSIFHNVKLTHEPNDYNVFNEDGVSLGGVAVASEHAIFPLKMVDEFDHDPLNVILNSFSKIKKDGEGASVQFVIRPREDFHVAQYKSALKRIEKGEKIKDAIKAESFAGGLGDALKKLIMPIENKKKETDKKEEKNDGFADREKIEAIKKKITESVMSVNIRLIVSAQTKEDAEKTLREIESAFNQFEKQGQNGIEWKHPEKKALSDMFREFSFRMFNEGIDFPLNLTEMGTLIHFPTASYAIAPQLKKADALSAPAPQDMPTSGTILGKNIYRGMETIVRMAPEDRLRHLYVIGQTGTGKSVFLKNMVIQDMIAGEGVCFIDPHGSDILDLLANVPKDRLDDVIYFDPSYVERPMALNMLEYDRSHPEQKTFVVNELFSIFQKLYGGNPESMGPMFEQYFRNATMLVIEDPETGCTLLDVSRVMADKAYRQLKLSRCKNPVVVQFWQEVAEKAGGEASLANIVPYITSKFDVFLANDIMRPIVAQEKSSFDFRDIMDNKKILLVNLSKGRLGDINANLIGLILVGKILMSALARVDKIDAHSTGSGQAGFPPFYLYIDEFQNITTNSISVILSEARKYKLSLNVAHQFISQLDEGIRDAVFGNVGSMVSFRISAEDATYLEKQFEPVFSAKDLMNINNLNACAKLLLNGRPAKPFNIVEEYPPRGNPSMIDSLKHLSYLKYGGDREEIEAEILKKYKK